MIATAFSSTGQSPRTVLIVEDERVSRRALALLLASHGFEISAVESAEDAVKLLRDGAMPAVAIVDLDLPGMNGLDLINVLKKLDPTVHPVLVTGADSERLEGLLRDRKVDCLRKPLDVRRLLALLETQ